MTPKASESANTDRKCLLIKLQENRRLYTGIGPRHKPSSLVQCGHVMMVFNLITA